MRLIDEGAALGDVSSYVMVSRLVDFGRQIN